MHGHDFLQKCINSNFTTEPRLICSSCMTKNTSVYYKPTQKLMWRWMVRLYYTCTYYSINYLRLVAWQETLSQAKRPCNLNKGQLYKAYCCWNGSEDVEFLWQRFVYVIIPKCFLKVFIRSTLYPYFSQFLWIVYKKGGKFGVKTHLESVSSHKSCS